MSRAYRVEVYARGISPEALGRLMTHRFGWIEINLFEYKGITGFTGSGFLTGGESEEEAHNEIYTALKVINKKALITSRWTYLEVLPFSEYGDKFDADTPLNAS